MRDRAVGEGEGRGDVQDRKRACINFAASEQSGRHGREDVLKRFDQRTGRIEGKVEGTSGSAEAEASDAPRCAEDWIVMPLVDSEQRDGRVEPPRGKAAQLRGRRGLTERAQSRGLIRRVERRSAARPRRLVRGRTLV